jgi:hypothetical protein
MQYLTVVITTHTGSQCTHMGPYMLLQLATMWGKLECVLTECSHTVSCAGIKV